MAELAASARSRLQKFFQCVVIGDHYGLDVLCEGISSRFALQRWVAILWETLDHASLNECLHPWQGLISQVLA